MQQIISNQNNNLKPIIRQNFKCLNNNQAQSVCISHMCQKSGFMCFKQNCNCRNQHLKCHHILLERIISSITQHQKQIPQDAKKYYESVYKMINNMIDQLSQLRQKFQLQQQFFGLQKEELKFISLVNDSAINKINGKIISELQKTFDTQIEISKFNQQSLKQKMLLTNTKFEELYQHVCHYYSQSQNKLTTEFLKDSNILKNSKQQIGLIHLWLTQNSLKQKNLKSTLLFRASEHSFKVKEFHRLCDGIPNTLIIIKNQYDKVFGGFTKGQWFSPSGFQYVKDTQGGSFIFSLTQRQKYECIEKQRSIRCAQQCGPSFGSGSPACDILIKDNANTSSESYCNFPQSFNLKNNKYQNNNTTSTIFTGNKNGNNFKVKEYEVYQIK